MNAYSIFKFALSFSSFTSRRITKRSDKQSKLNFFILTLTSLTTLDLNSYFIL